MSVEATPTFPNGFSSWYETFYEIAAAIGIEANGFEPSGLVAQTLEVQGTGGLYELAKELTDKFEMSNKGREWDGDFFDEIEAFIEKELYQ
ncbi:MAG: hypothetical protein IM613_17415 [Cytophagales bacterium]|nr:hypothetical protein [Cytophagales bacterium]